MTLDRRPATGQGSAGGGHRHDVRVYYEDTDAGGVVYYANYLRYAERARTEFLRSLGVEQEMLRRTQGLALAVRRCVCDFHRPAHLDDVLTVESALVGQGPAHLDLNQTIRREALTLVELFVTIVCVRDGRAARIPGPVRAAFAKLESDLPFSRRKDVVRSPAARGVGAG